MSTQSFTTPVERGLGRFAIALLVGCMLALQCWLPTAFASTRGVRDADASTKLALDKAGVSIVRLIASYRENNSNANNPNPKTFSCTGLGILVGSARQSVGSGYVNWVLTSSALVYSSMSSCENVDQNGSVLSDVKIYPSAEYSRASAGTTPETVSLGELTCQASGQSPNCSDATGSGAGTNGGNKGQAEALHLLISTQANWSYTLFSFQTPQPQPYLLRSSTAQGNLSTSSIIGLLSTSNTTLPNAVVATNQPNAPLAFLVPDIIPSSSPVTPTLTTSTQTIEDGTPVVSPTGVLLGMYVSNGQSPQLLRSSSMSMTEGGTTILPAPAGPADLVTQWNAGIEALDQPTPDKVKAHKAFQQVMGLNGDFGAAKFFDAQTVTPTATKNQTPSGVTPTSTTSNATSFSWALLILLAAGVIALALLLVIVTMRLRRRRRDRAAFEAERVEAERIAGAEIERQRSYHAQAQRPSESEIQRQHVQPQAQLFCPNCHNPVQLNDAACPTCHILLSPSASGSNVRLRGTSPLPAYQPAPASMPPAASMSNNVLSAPVAAPMSEQPTLQFPPAPVGAPGADMAAPLDDRTLIGHKQAPGPDESLHHMPQQQGHILLLNVGTYSDPGIKRKHKPNEDSLFAMQGARTHNSEPQQFGLLVVADGMGGHANGQDASRLAIQTMIDFMLPRISTAVSMDEVGFRQLLAEGVQSANQAVHNRNMEARADMGTTMTTTLVVGTTAFVANVGDSRTYLYRDGHVIKVTNDHSVVASLVEAGIIKPDDIYTHPKRNQIYRSLGEKAMVEVDTFKVDLQAGDKLLLCSDGLWDMVRDPIIEQVLSMPINDPNQIGKELINAAMAGGGEDNVSVIVAQFVEANEHTGQTGMHLLAKPESVTVPNFPPL